jgi:LPS-assembly lipoprotein
MLGGCGFRPIHGPAGGAQGDDIAQDLAAIRVPILRERFGQLTRRGLEQRLATGSAGGVPARFELRVQPALQVEGIGVDLSGAATRVRYVGGARWALLRIGPPEAILATGFERATDAYNVPTNQYFASDIGREATERRLADALADEVVVRVAVALRRLREAPGSLPVPTGPVPGPGPIDVPVPDNPLSSIRPG